MVAQFNILGRQVGSHYLAIATLGSTVLGSWLALRSGSKAGASGKPVPPLQAASADEESFIKDFLRAAEQEEKKAKH
ncbi:hypothetical protein EV426DRAFT_624986 [Tirmania nivea]|nr:hypothetical protein EV426DRAFT_624986 [Tirmania nivea]